MDRTLHDIRNDLAVAIASMHAFIDGKLASDQANLQIVLKALEDVDAAISKPPTAAPRVETSGKESFLSAIIDGSPYAKVLVNNRGRIALVNAQAEKLFGYTRDELLGQSIEMLVPARFRHGHPALRSSFTAAPAARPMGAGRDLYGRRKDGSEVPIEIGLNPIETDVETFTLAAISDITERKRSEELRLLHAGMQQHATELEELNRELASASRFKTQFVATMSHELRTPLTAIIGAAELLSKATLDERSQIGVQTINEAAEALFALINTVLDFSKIEAGKMELQTAPFEIPSVLEGAAEVVAELARSKGIVLHTYVDPAIPPLLLGDAGRLRQIVMNLLGNAVKFTERGYIVARALPVETLERDVVLRFEVEDTGVGISPGALAQLFEPFVQGDASTSRRFGGTGLGLSISRSLVELMGGEIGVKSDPAVGSLFWFTARFGRATALVSRNLDDIAGVILTRDDTFARIVERYLRSWSMESVRGESWDDVLRIVQSGEPRTWVGIVDLDTIGAGDAHATVAPRIIFVGNDRPLRKPLRQSYLFDALVKAGRRHSASDAPAVATVVDVVLMTQAAVLVAEDNVGLQRLLKLQFDDLGVPVTFVSDGREAVEAVRREQYAMVFMDCQMPNMDGLAATAAIREYERSHGSARVPIAAMTANAFAEDRIACLDAGMDDYLSKPVRLADLRGMLERWSRP